MLFGNDMAMNHGSYSFVGFNHPHAKDRAAASLPHEAELLPLFPGRVQRNTWKKIHGLPHNQQTFSGSALASPGVYTYFSINEPTASET